MYLIRRVERLRGIFTSVSEGSSQLGANQSRVSFSGGMGVGADPHGSVSATRLAPEFYRGKVTVGGLRASRYACPTDSLIVHM